MSLTKWDTEAFRNAQQTALEGIQLVLLNNKYLCKVNGISLAKQFRNLSEQGVKISSAYYHRLVKGRRRTCSIVFLSLFSNYWGISLGVLMSRDMAKEDELRKLKELRDAETE